VVVAAVAEWMPAVAVAMEHQGNSTKLILVLM
jgi:hypothetical protein